MGRKFGIRILLLFFAFSLLFSFKSNAQLTSALDTIKSSFHHKPKFLIDISSYNSIINGQAAIFTDIAFGVVFNKRLYFSGGVSFLNTEVTSEQVVQNNFTTAQLHMDLFVVNAEYVFFKNYPWIVSVIPFKIGFGNAYYEYISEPDKIKKKINEHTIVTYQPQFYASYNIVKYFGISSSIGYRFTPFSPSQIHKDLDSFTYSFGVKLFLDPIYNALFPNGIFHKKPHP